MAGRTRDYDFLLLGKTGAGKSATGNTILGRKGFQSGCSTSSITTRVALEKSDFEGRVLTVVDTPGIGDTRSETEEAEVKRVLSSVEDVMRVNPGGYHAFLIVMRYGTRFTEEDRKMVQFLKTLFGEDILGRFGIVVFTCGDNFEVEREQTGISFDYWVGSQTGAFQDLVRDCQHRVVLFDNVTNEPAVRNSQVRNLLHFADRLIATQSNRYTDLNFRLAGPSRQKVIIAAEGRRISMDVMNQVMELSDGLRHALANNPQSQVSRLKDLLARCEKLMEDVRVQDKCTGALQFILDMIEPTRKSLSEALKTQTRLAEITERRQREEAESKRRAEEELRRKQEEMRRHEEQVRQEEERRRAREQQRVQEKERQSREREAELQRQLEREREERKRQEEELQRARAARPRSRSPPIDRKVVREVNRVVNQVGRLFKW